MSTVLPTGSRARPSLPITRSPENCNVVNALLRLAVGTEPALDDLHTVEVRPVRVAQGADDEGRGRAIG